MPFLVPLGAAIISGATAVAGAVGTALGAGAFGAFVANGIMAAGYGLAALTGASGLGAALSAWGTVLAASTALTAPSIGRGPAGTQVDFQADPNAGIPLTIGRTGVAGKIFHVNTTGAQHKNGHIFYLVALSAGPIESVQAFTAADMPVTFAGDTAQTGKFLNQMWLRSTLGAKPEPGPLVPGGFDPSWAPELTAAHKLSGIATAAWSMYFSPEAYPTGTPKPMWVVSGPAVYDPRQDDTYPGGGSGPQRWDNEATWAFAGKDNPYLQALTFCIGRRANGRLTHGLGATIEAIDVPAFVYGANVCDANAWRIGGEITSADRKRDVLRVMLQAGGGQPVPLGGKISCTVQAPRVSLATVTGDDLVGEAVVPGTKTRRDRFNQGIPLYRSEAHNWEIVPAGPVRVEAFVEQDGGLRSREMSYQLVQDAGQAAQLCAYDILDAREFEPVVLPLKPVYMGYKPGDCITVNEPELLLINQPMVVLKREIDLISGAATLTLRSETSAKHDFALGRTATPPPLPGLSSIDPSFVSAPNLGSWTATGGVLESSDGSAMPAIIITGAVDDPNVSNVLVDYRLVLDPAGTAFGDWVSTEHPSKVRRIELRALISKAKYHVRVRYRTYRNIEGQLALDLGIVEAGSLVVGVSTIGGLTPAQLVAELNYVAAQGNALTAAALEAALRIQEERAELFKQVYHEGLGIKVIVLDEVTQRTEGDAFLLARQNLMGLVTEDGSAWRMSDTTLMASPTQTWGQYKDSLLATFNSVSAAITAESTVRATQDTALAQSVTNVSTTVGGHTASITSMSTSINGLSAQHVLAVSAGDQVAGMRLAAGGPISSIAFSAGQIGFTNGTSTVYTLAVVGSEVIATQLRAGKVIANSIVTDSILADNIVETVQGADNSTVTLPTSSAVTVVSIVPYFIKGRVTIKTLVNISNGGGEATALVEIRRDGSTIDSYVEFGQGAWGNNAEFWEVDDTPSPGYHTYSIVITRLTPGGGPLSKTRARIAAELRKTES